MNRLSWYLMLILLCSSGFILAQNPSKVTIKSSIHDTTNAEVPFATVMLLNPKDSTLVNYTLSDINGAFAFNNVKNIPYLLKVSHMSYLPHQQMVQVSATPVNNIGVVRVKPLSVTLMEVVVRAAKAPLRIRGDTVEYDATTFKVPPGSTVEDLLRRLPGIEVDADGNIKTQGKDVKRVYVDGKTFFGDDPKSVTKNLGAETISKVQVYDEKSEQTKLTGVDDGTKEKSMNLELKEEFKKGSFGKVTGAGGNRNNFTASDNYDRYAGRANYNRFNDKNQLSFIGYANNINQTGVNWEDYGEFKGQNTFNDYDNGDFGFGNGGMRYYSFNSDDSPLNNFDGRGFTKNLGAGSNYNYDNKKTKFNLSYFFNQTRLSLDQFTSKQTFTDSANFLNSDTLGQSNFRGNHSIASRFEKNLDSNNVIIVKANIRFSTSNSTSHEDQLYSNSESIPLNSLGMKNGTDLNSWRVTSASIFRHRFIKKGRSLAISAGYNISRSDGTDNLFSLNKFFKANTITEQIQQLKAKQNDASQFKSSLLYTEPLSKKWYWESFYNFSISNNAVNRQVQRQNTHDSSLSVFYTNDVLYNRLGTSIRYSNKGLNTSLGIAAQQLKLTGNYFPNRGETIQTDSVKRTFFNWTPNLTANYQLPHNMWLGLNYSYNIIEPQLTDLQSVPNVDNPLYRFEGNPELKPQRMHSFNLNYNYWNPASFASIGFGSDLNIYDQNIVYNQTVEVMDSLGLVTTSKPANVKGGNSFNTYIWSSYPIIKTKLTLNIYGSINTGSSPALVNNVENDTKNRGFNINIGFNITPDPKLIFNIEQGIEMNNITYSIHAEQNQKIRNYSTEAAIKWQFATKFFFESNFNYSIYRNDRFNFNRDMPIWNGSVRRILGKKNRLEMRLAAFDILNKRVYISQYGSQNYIQHTSAPTLARYFMLSATYNLRGFEDKLKKNNYW